MSDQELRDVVSIAYQSPVWTFIYFFITAVVFVTIMESFANLVNRVIRHLNIRKAGWPPEHLDADGEHVFGMEEPEFKDEEEEARSDRGKDTKK